MKNFVQLVLISSALGVALGVPTLKEISSFQQSPSTNCSCGIRNSARERIVGGETARANEFPWRCYLGYRNKPFCGCSIISNQWIMTAGHCSEALVRSSIEEFEIVAGAHDWTKKGESTRQSFKVFTKDVILHPQYREITSGISSAPENDITLIKLPRQLNFNRAVSPVCLPWNYKNKDFSGSQVTASGWGRMSPWIVSGAEQLQKVDLPVISNMECSDHWIPRDGTQFITNKTICTNHREEKGSCKGDSGGSIDYEENGQYYAIGITSWGSFLCGSYPTVYARTTEFLEWISQTTNENFCKKMS